jgi:hypothetical protein
MSRETPLFLSKETRFETTTLASSLSEVGSALAKDSRFWPPSETPDAWPVSHRECLLIAFIVSQIANTLPISSDDRDEIRCQLDWAHYVADLCKGLLFVLLVAHLILRWATERFRNHSPFEWIAPLAATTTDAP